MERILKAGLLLLILMIGSSVKAETNYVVKPVTATQAVQQVKVITPQNISPTVPQVISFEQCTKKYEISVEKLFFLSLASVNANKFKIDEIQSKTGYILFSAAGRQYLASVNRVDNKSAILKIVPADNNYYFPLGVLTNFFKYIDLNLSSQIDKLG